MQNFSTSHVIIKQLLVEPSLNLSFSHDDLLDVPCDEYEMCDNASVLHALDPNSIAENKHVMHIASANDELKLLYSLQTLGYIEFDDLCNLYCLVEKLFQYADLPWFDKHMYHVVGKYDNKGQYLIHKVYIHSNMNSPFVVQDYDQLEDSHTAHFSPRSSSSVFMKQVYYKEGEPLSLLPMLVCTNRLQGSVVSYPYLK